MEKSFIFKLKVKWTGGKKGSVSAEDKPDLTIATPPEFGGERGNYSPEELFIASVNSCILTTFLYFADRLNVKFESYTAEAEGKIVKTEGPFVFREIEVRPTVEVKNNKEKKKALKALELTEKYCIITNSINKQVSVTLKPTVKALTPSQ